MHKEADMSPGSSGAHGKEFLVVNIGSGVQAGASISVVGVAESLDAAMEMVRKMGAAPAGKILIAEKTTVVTRTPIVELKESQDTILVPPQ
jgi:hypothetical protein